MEAIQKKIKQRLKKHWMLLALGSLAVVLLGAMAAKDFLKTRMSTPIAHIEPDSSVKTVLQPSRLDSYKKEVEEINKENIKRQMAMEKIIAMDFGQGFPVNEVARPPAGNLEKETTVEATEIKPAPSKPTISKAPKPRVKPLQSAKDKKEKPEVDLDNGFYTIKADIANSQVMDSLSRTEDNFFKAVVNGDQKLIGNAILSLRLTEAATVKGHTFPRNTMVYGRASGGMGGRIKVRVTRIQTVPVVLAVFDNDYQEGIAYLSNEPVSTALADTRHGAVDEVLNAIPYGGVASGLADLGKSIVRKSRKAKPVFLADGYPVFIALEQ